jgi:hypothetical protein
MSFILSLLFLLLGLYIVNLIVEALKLPENIKNIVYIIVAVVFLMALVNSLGFYSFPMLR